MSPVPCQGPPIARTHSHTHRYWDTQNDVPTFLDLEAAQFSTLMIGQIAEPHEHLLAPISADAKLFVNKKSADAAAADGKIAVETSFDVIQLNLSRQHYRDLQALSSSFAQFARQAPYLEWRPAAPVRADPRAWWRFAIGCEMRRVAARREQFSWARIARRRDLRQRYVPLWQKGSKKDRAEVEAIEEQLSAEDIILFRSIAYLNEAAAERDDEEKNAGSWWWSAAKKKRKAEEKAKSSPPTDDAMTPEERAAFYDTIGYTENEQLPDMAELDRHAVLARVELGVKRFGLCMPGLMETSVVGLEAAVKVRPGSWDVAVAVADLSVVDLVTRDARFPNVVSRTAASNAGNLLTVAVESNPLDGRADMAIQLSARALDVVYVPRFVDELVGFFKIEDRDVVAQLEAAALERLDSLKEGTLASLESAVNAHKTIDLHAQISAPTLIIPQCVTHAEAAAAPLLLVADLGQLSVDSALATTKRAPYDRYQVKVEAVTLLIAPSLKHLLDARSGGHGDAAGSWNIMHPLNLDLALLQSVVPTDPKMTKIKVSASLPLVQATLSTEQYRGLMRVLRFLKRERSSPQLAVGSVEDLDDIQHLATTVSLRKPAAAMPKKGSAESALLVAKTLLEADFTVGRVMATLSTAQHDLVTFRLGDVHARVVQRTFDLAVDASVGALVVEDHLAGLEMAQADKVLTVRHYAVKDESPEYSGVSADIGVQLGHVRLHVDRNTIVQLVEFAMSLKVEREEEVVVAAAAPKAALAAVAPKNNTKTVTPTRQRATNVDMRLALHLSAVTLTLTSGSKALAELAVTNTQVAVRKFPLTQQVEGTLGGLAMYDLSQAPHRARDLVLGTQNDSDHLVSFKFETWSEREHDFPGHHSAINLQLEQFWFVFYKRLADDLQHFAGPLVLAASSKAVAQSAAAAAAAVDQSVSRTKLDVTLVAPIIRVPVVTGSADEVVANLGTLRVTNAFDDREDGVATDCMSIELTRLSVQAAGAEVLKRTDLSLTVTRALLTPAQEDAFGAVRQRINLQLPAIDIGLSRAQYVVLMQLAEGNLKERPLVCPPPAPKAKAVAAATAETNLDVAMLNEPQQLGDDTGKTGSKMSLNLRIDSVAARLVDMAALHVNSVGLAVDQFYDAVVKVKLSVAAVSLADSRPGSVSQFPEMLSIAEGAASDVLTAVVVRTATGDVEADVGLTGLYGTIAPEIVFALKGFFAKPLPASSELSGKLVPAEVDWEPVAPVADSTSVAPKPSSSSSSSYTTVRLSIVDPYLMLVENSAAAESRAVVLEFGGAVQYTETEDGVRKVAAQVSSCNVFVSRAKSQVGQRRLHRPKHAFSVVDPFDVSLLVAIQPEGDTAVHLDVDLVKVRVSYQDIRMVQKIGDAFKEANEAAKVVQVVEEEDEEAEDDGDTSLPFEPLATKPHPQHTPSESVSLTARGVQVTLINDLYGEMQNQPLVNAVMNNLAASIEGWSSELVVRAGVRLKLDYYHAEISTWEPAVEPWEFELQLRESELEGRIVGLDSPHKLDLNVSEALLRTVATIKNLAASGDEPEPQGEQSGESSGLLYSPYWLENLSGLDITAAMNDKAAVAVPAASRVPFNPVGAAAGSRGTSFDLSAHITLHFAGDEFKPVRRMNVTHTGTYPVRLQGAAKGPPQWLLCDVDFVRGSKIMTLRTAIVVANETDHDFEVSLGDAPGAPLPAGGRFCVPHAARARGIVQLSGSTGGVQLGQLSKLVNTAVPVAVPGVGRFLCAIEDQRGDGDYVVHIRAPLVVENALATPMGYRLLSSNDLVVAQGTLAPGQKVERPEFGGRVKGAAVSVEVPAGSNNWSEPSQGRLFPSLPDSVLVEGYSAAMPKLWIQMDAAVGLGGSLQLTAYSPYWIYNRTGLPINVRETTRLQSSLDRSRSGKGSSIAPFRDQPDMAPNAWRAKQAERPLKPLMFSFDDVLLKRRKVAVSVLNSNWSGPFGLDSVGSDGVVSAEDSGRGGTRYELGCSIALGSGPFWRTKLVTFTPRYVLMNDTGSVPLEVRQANAAGDGWALASGDSVPIQWSAKAREPMLEVRVGTDGSKWSAALRVDGITDIVFVASGTMLVARVRSVGATMMVSFATVADVQVPYRIVNETSHPVLFGQRGAGSKPQRLAPGAAVPYAWEKPEGEHKLVVSIPGTKIDETLSLAEIRRHRPRPVGNGEFVVFAVGTQGSTRVLRVIDKAAELVRRRREESEAGSVVADDETTDGEYSVVSPSVGKSAGGDVPKMSLHLKLSSIGVSVVDAAAELLYVTLERLDVSLVESQLRRAVSFNVGVVQVDNMREGTAFPVLLSPVMESADKNTVALTVVQNLAHSNGTDFYYFDYFSVLVQMLDVRSDEDILLSLASLGGRAGKLFAAPSSSSSSSSSVSAAAPFTLPTVTESSTRMYFELLVLNAIKVNLTFSPSAGDDDPEASLGGMSSFSPIRTLFQSIGVTMVNINEAPLRLNALVLEHPFVTADALASQLKVHYTRQALAEAYKVVGSFDFLGNPVGLFHNLGTGAMEFFLEPAQGLHKGPEEFAAGVARGTMSLLKNSIHGVFGSATSITSTVGKGLAALSFDDDYQRRRQAEQVSTRNERIGTGAVLTSVRGIGSGFASGITGLVAQPKKGLEEDGGKRPVAGFLRGLGRGAIGLVALPAGAAVDAVTHTAQGVRNVARSGDFRRDERVRPPRRLGDGRVLLPYAYRDARGQQLLHSVSGGKYRAENYQWHVNTRGGHTILLSDERVILQCKGEKQWSQRYDGIVRIVPVSGGKALLELHCFDQKRPRILPVAHDRQADHVKERIEALQQKAKQKAVDVKRSQGSMRKK